MKKLLVAVALLGMGFVVGCQDEVKPTKPNSGTSAHSPVPTGTSATAPAKDSK
jgi:hypothetical protein